MQSAARDSWARGRRSAAARGRWLASASALVLVVHAAGCGRVGYEVLRTDGTAGDAGAPAPDAAVSRPPDPGTDALTASDGPLPALDAAPPDVAPPADAPPPGDSAPVPDTSPPIDAVPDTPAAPRCTLAAALDMIADFEDGTLDIHRVSGRGGTTFHLVDRTAGTLTNVPMTNCGRRAMQVVAATSSRSPLVQGSLADLNDTANYEWFDARGHRGVSIALRASTPVQVRLKLANGDTLSGGHDHFQVPIAVGTTFTSLSLAWSAFKQTMAGTAIQYPSFDVSRLQVVELSASLPAGATLWVDEIAFWR